MTQTGQLSRAEFTCPDIICFIALIHQSVISHKISRCSLAHIWHNYSRDGFIDSCSYGSLLGGWVNFIDSCSYGSLLGGWVNFIDSCSYGSLLGGWVNFIDSCSYGSLLGGWVNWPTYGSYLRMLWAESRDCRYRGPGFKSWVYYPTDQDHMYIIIPVNSEQKMN